MQPAAWHSDATSCCQDLLESLQCGVMVGGQGYENSSRKLKQQRQAGHANFKCFEPPKRNCKSRSVRAS